MDYLLSSEQAEAYLSRYYNYDRAFIVESDKEAVKGLQELVDGKKKKGRPTRQYKHNLPLLYVQDGVLMPAPFDDLINGLLSVFSEEGNTRPFIAVSKVISITSITDDINTNTIVSILKCSKKTAQRYYNFIVLLDKAYNKFRNNKIKALQ